MKPRVSSLLFALVALIAGAGCDSHADSVCQDIGDCSQGGSSVWIASCQAEAKALQGEANSAACGADFDTYFSCADSNYSCHGATAVFPGCAEHLTALDACLAAATANTSCARLATMEASCAAAPDAGTGPGTPPACTAARDCQAACYLTNVVDVCAPRVDEIQSVTTCASTCPL
jgi:hypothetical protein